MQSSITKLISSPYAAPKKKEPARKQKAREAKKIRNMLKTVDQSFREGHRATVLMGEDTAKIAKQVKAEMRRGLKAVSSPSAKNGFIYLVENDVFPGWIKCGMTIDLDARLKQYNGGDPLKRYSFVETKHVVDRRKAERLLIHNLKMASDLVSGEWFRVSKDQSQVIFKDVE